jgi:hypothetical protein
MRPQGNELGISAAQDHATFKPLVFSERGNIVMSSGTKQWVLYLTLLQLIVSWIDI